MAPPPGSRAACVLVALFNFRTNLLARGGQGVLCPEADLSARSHVAISSPNAKARFLAAFGGEIRANTLEAPVGRKRNNRWGPMEETTMGSMAGVNRSTPQWLLAGIVLLWIAAVIAVPQHVHAQTFPLVVSKTGTGGGTVTSSGGEIACGATCSATLASGSEITLTATPASTSTFIGWSGGGCSGTGTCALALTQARNVSAMFGGSGEAAFSAADLAGTWRVFSFMDDRAGNSPRWIALAVTLDETGALVSGTSDTLNGTEQTGTLTGATFTIDPASGLVSGAVWGNLGEVTFPYAQMDLSKSVMSTVASQGADRRGMTIGLKGGGSFTAVDLKGTWHLSQFSDTVGAAGNDP